MAFSRARIAIAERADVTTDQIKSLEIADSTGEWYLLRGVSTVAGEADRNWFVSVKVAACCGTAHADPAEDVIDADETPIRLAEWTARHRPSAE